MTTMKMRVLLAVALVIGLAAVPSASSAQGLPRRGSEHSRANGQDRGRSGDRDNTWSRARGQREEQNERGRRDDDDDQGRYGREQGGYGQYGDVYGRGNRGQASTCQAQYRRLVAQERYREAQWNRNQGRYGRSRNAAKHEAQRRRQFRKKLDKLQQRCGYGNVYGRQGGVYGRQQGGVYGRSGLPTQLPRDRNGDGRIDSRDQANARRDQRSGSGDRDDTWSRARSRGHTGGN